MKKRLPFILVIILVLISVGFIIYNKASLSTNDKKTNDPIIEEKESYIESEETILSTSTPEFVEEEQEVQEEKEVKKENTDVSSKQETKVNNNNNSNTNTSNNSKENNSTDNSTTNQANNNSNQVTSNEQPKEQNIWDELGITEYDYYHKPMWSWTRIDFSINDYQTEENTKNACISKGNQLMDESETGLGYSCQSILSYSGDYLGEMMETF